MFRVGSRKSARAPPTATENQTAHHPRGADEAGDGQELSLDTDAQSASNNIQNKEQHGTVSAPDAHTEQQRQELAAKRTAAASWIAEHCDVHEPREVTASCLSSQLAALTYV